MVVAVGVVGVVVEAVDPGPVGYHSTAAVGTAVVAGSMQPRQQHSGLQPACLQ